MAYGNIMLLYALYTEHETGTSDFELLSGQDFLLLNLTNFLLLGV